MNLERAIEIAVEAHRNQKDRYGKPYIGHITRVMNSGKNDEERIVGIIHDIVEKTEWTFERLELEGFPNKIVDAVRCISKTSDEEDYDHFIERVKKSSLAIKVKLYDLTDNMDLRRMSEVTEADIDRLNKYLKAYNILSDL